MSLEQSILTLADAIREQTKAAIALAGPRLKSMGGIPPALFVQAENEIAARAEAAIAAPAADPADPADPAAPVSTAKKGPGRPKKADATPANTTPPTVDAGMADANGTTFWHNTKHDAVYRIVPGDGSSPIANSTQINEADFLEHQTRLAAKYRNLPGMPGNPAQTQAAATSLPTAAAEPVAASTVKLEVSDFQTTKTALLALSKARDDGRARVLAILKRHSANSVPEIANKTPEEFGQIMREVKEASE